MLTQWGALYLPSAVDFQVLLPNPVHCHVPSLPAERNLEERSEARYFDETVVMRRISSLFSEVKGALGIHVNLCGLNSLQLLNSDVAEWREAAARGNRRDMKQPGKFSSGIGPWINKVSYKRSGKCSIMNDPPWKKSVKQVLKFSAEALKGVLQIMWADCHRGAGSESDGLGLRVAQASGGLITFI